MATTFETASGTDAEIRASADPSATVVEIQPAQAKTVLITDGSYAVAVKHSPVTTSKAGLSGPVGPQTLASFSGVQISGNNSIQNAVNANPNGTTFVLSGTFTSQSVSPKDGNKFIGLTGAVMNGNSNVDHAFQSGAPNVLIKNLTIRNYTAPLQKGTVNALGPNWLIEACDISGTTRGAAVNVMNDNVTVKSCRLHHNNQQGFSVHGDILGRAILNTLFENVEIDHNNEAGETWSGSEQGGGKLLRSDGAKFLHCYSHDNGGSGIWFDYNNIRSIVDWCKFGWNWNRLEFEIGYDFKVLNCDFSEAGGPQNMNDDMGVSDILMGNAGGLAPGGGEIAYNTFGPGGVEAQHRRILGGREQSGRSPNDQYGTPGEIRRNRNIYVHHNTFDLTKCTTHDGKLFGLREETDNTAFTHPEHMTFDYNTYKLRADQKPFVWDDKNDLSVAQWKGYGLDAHSTFEIVGAPPATAAVLSATAKNSRVTLSSDKLTATASLRGSGRTDQPIPTNVDTYYEVTIATMPATYNAGVGYCNVNQTFGNADWLGRQPHGVGYYSNGQVWFNYGVVVNWASFAQGNTICWAFRGNKYWVRVNGGPWNGNSSANPATGTGFFTQNEGVVYPAYDIAENGAGGSVKFNFGATPFLFTKPNGYVGLGA